MSVCTHVKRGAGGAVRSRVVRVKTIEVVVDRVGVHRSCAREYFSGERGVACGRVRAGVGGWRGERKREEEGCFLI